MKQEIKSELSRQRITQAAIKEFGKGTYDSVSVTQICTRHHIAKGLLYHYFRGKDELYLACVKKCFDELEAYLAEQNLEFTQFKRDICNYMEKRRLFFAMHPDLENIFFQSMIYPPEHLLKSVAEVRKRFDLLNLKFFRQLLQTVDLRPEISEQEAADFFMLIRDSYHSYIRNHFVKGESVKELHETYIERVLDKMLYGVAKKNE